MNDDVSSFPAAGKGIRKSKTSPQSLPLHPDEKLVLETYLSGAGVESPELAEACDRLEVPKDVVCRRVDAAVAQVLLHAVQARLPQWSAVRDDRVVLSRRYRRRASGQALAFVAQHLFTINWANSGPGFSWPEAYHLVYVPGYERWVVTASQDGGDVWGCSDQAIGFFRAGNDESVERAGRLIRRRWRSMHRDWDQGAWCELFDEGLVPSETAEQWRKRIWGRASLEY